MLPKEIRKKSDHEIVITWPNEQASVLQSLLLRKNCPCAHCKKDNLPHAAIQLPVKTPSHRLLPVVSGNMQEELTIKKITGIGNYAIKIEFLDGHNTGIYTFELLQKLAGI